jgi:hypothetical protein
LKIIFTAIILFFTGITFSQNLIQNYGGINFNVNGNNSPAPFNGGINNARFQFVDIDGDSDLDLFTFDSDTSLYYYKNIGTPQSASYYLVSTRFQSLYFKNWFYFVDIDSDNDMDLFTGGDLQTVMYFRNDGNTSSPNFKLVISELRTNTDTVIYSESNCVPTFCDIDNDGDKDFFTGQSLGTITYYENIGTSSNFSLKYITDLWEDLLIISPAFDNRHGANSIEFTDIDNDNDFDLFWGDLFSKGIYYIKNTGTASDPEVVIADSTYPVNSPFVSQGYNSTRFVDIDNDGDKDLFISVLYLSQNKHNFVFYKNNGSSSVPIFEKITDDYLSLVDAGGNSSIAFTDIDNDGDKDLFIGNDYSTISFYRNTTVTNFLPSYDLVTDSLPILSHSFNYAPAFADLDNDGDMDMLLGSYIKDSLWFFRNTGTPEQFDFTLEARGHQIGIVTLGQSSTPAFVDIDNDGDKDLFLGGTNGRVIYYENTGSVNNFNFVYVTNYYNNIDVGDESVPRFFDIDTDGDYDMFIGKQNGKISYYRNEGSPAVPAFVFQTAEYKDISVHSNSCPEFADIDNDTDPDLFIGNIKGGLFYYRNEDVNSVNIVSSELPENFSLYQNYPNPFNPTTTIKFDLRNNATVKLSVYDVSGKEVSILVNENLSSGSYEYSFGANNLSSGMYFYRLESGNLVISKSMLLIK